MLYRCQLENRQRLWFISEVPSDMSPGTQQDCDFYFSLCQWEGGGGDCISSSSSSSSSSIPPQPFNTDGQGYYYPPENGWRIIGDGQSPPPIVLFRSTVSDRDYEVDIKDDEGSSSSIYRAANDPNHDHFYM